MLINNREKTKESESFILTLQKDKMLENSSQRRINVKKILSLDDLVNAPYKKVTIEVKNNYNLDEIKSLLQKEGETEINLIINNNSNKLHYSLQKKRKFDFNQLKMMKNKEYVKKITV